MARSWTGDASGKNPLVIFRQRAATPAGETPPNRLGSKICKAGVEAKLGKRFGWKPLWVPLPLRGEGYLDVVYLSPTMRITRGNRGGVFVHLRPELLTREAVESVEIGAWGM